MSTTDRGRPELWVCDMGLVPYMEALALQEELAAARREERLADTLLLLEHPAVITRGRRTQASDVPLPEEFYGARGIELIDVKRGGKLTYHGPGQLVGYPIVAVSDVPAYLRMLEAVLIEALAKEGIQARSRHREGPDFTGVWVAERKIASIGVHLSRGITTHGFALNVENDLEPFSWFVPCGLPGVAMTSLAQELPDRPPDMTCMRRRIALGLAEALGARQPVPVRVRLISRARLQERAGPESVVPVTSTAPRRAPTRDRVDPQGQRVLEVLGSEVRPVRERKPPWFRVPARGGPRYRELSRLISSENLHTVCQEAACPNVGECWERGTATFMILGDTCTRRCGFCNVKTGRPTWNDPLEPARVARSIARMGLRHAVVTSVDRDDLPDKGADAFVGVIRQVRRQAPGCQIEVLTPDFQGREELIGRVASEGPDVFNHNVEVVPRLYPVARRGSLFARSCRVLETAKRLGGDRLVTKSGLMVGLGETREELLGTFMALRQHGVQVLTVGQYLRPSAQHLPVVRYWHPDEFAALERDAYELGFEHVAAGPLVRSSYHADQHVPQGRPGEGPLAGVGKDAARA